LKNDHRQQAKVAIALYDFAIMTGCHPKVTAEALIRLQREGMTDVANPKTITRFRELIEVVKRNQKQKRIED
jgi:ABC-type uncharacterized transport system auxiliary subunit